LLQKLFQSVLATIENGGKPVQVNASTTLGYTKEQAEATHRLKSAKDNYERLGLTAGATILEINRAFRRLAILIHPDKSLAPGTEDASMTIID
ncbi:unnamed protein product, partial [Pocillopora meandrina]